jgi:hypothetical protein
VSWLYVQRLGALSLNSRVYGLGYSGLGEGKNNPAKQETHNVGPIPVGGYTIEAPHDSVLHGPFVLPLTPDPTNSMFGRSAFLIHGDSKTHPGQASEGCIIMPRDVREAVWASTDHHLQVISD